MKKALGKLLIFGGAAKLTLWIFVMPFYISIAIQKYGWIPTFPMNLLWLFNPALALIMIYYGSKAIDERDAK
jgi:hypothetical protein